MSDEQSTQAPPVNPPPAEAALAVYVIREVLACLFVVFWLLLFSGELLTARYTLPFWYHAVSVAVLAYALGLGIGQLLAYQAPTPAGVARGVIRRHREGEG